VNASDISGEDPSSMEPNDDGSIGVSVDDGSDENEFDEPWGCLKPWESADEESSESGSADDCKPKALDVNRSNDPLEIDNVMRYGIALESTKPQMVCYLQLIQVHGINRYTKIL
jgi:hypothetical protein